MAITPYRVRVTLPGQNFAPPPFRDGTSERFFYTMALMVDALMEKRVQATWAHIPANNINMGSTVIKRYAPDSCLAQIGKGYAIPRGLTEGSDSYATRLQHVYESYRFGGMARGMLEQTLGFLLAFTPQVRTVATIFDPSTYPPTRGDSEWDTYPVGRDPTTEPVHVEGVPSGNGDFDWDSLSGITGSFGSWSGYVALYAVAPNAFCAPAQNWGTNAVYTAAANGRYSTISGGVRFGAGSYAGTSQAWGVGATYAPGVNRRYSKVLNGARVPSGNYVGQVQGFGTSVSSAVFDDIAVILAQFKPGAQWIRSVMCVYDITLLDPSQPSGGGINPDGWWGRWSKIVAGARVASRLGNIAYGGEIV